MRGFFTILRFRYQRPETTVNPSARAAAGSRRAT